MKFRNRLKKARPMDLDLDAEEAISFLEFDRPLNCTSLLSIVFKKVLFLCSSSSVFRSPSVDFPCCQVKSDIFLTDHVIQLHFVKGTRRNGFL